MKREDLTYSILDDGLHPCAQFDSVDRAIRALLDAADAIDTEREAQTLDALAADCDAITDAICSALRLCAERIPLPRGFFVGEEHRAPAYAAVCRMLIAIEERVTQLQAVSMRVAVLLEAVAKKRELADPARFVLLGAKASAQEQTDGAGSAQIEKLAATLTERIARTERLLHRAQALESNLYTFLNEQIPHLLQAIEQASDMEHDGKGCNPIAASRLLSAFCDTVHRRNGGKECLNI